MQPRPTRSHMQMRGEDKILALFQMVFRSLIIHADPKSVTSGNHNRGKHEDLVVLVGKCMVSWKYPGI